MPFEFKFPDVGEGIHEGEIVKWRVKVGDEIKEDQVLLEMETAKAIVELPSPAAGKVLAVHGKEGEEVKVGAVLVTIEEKGVKGGASQASPGVIGQIPTESGVVLPGRSVEMSNRPDSASAGILPKIRKLAQELGVDLAKVKGSGLGGRITEEDVKKAQTSAFHGPVERVPLHGIRKEIARNMVKSANEIPQVTHVDEFDATNLVKLRESKKAEAEKRGIKLTFLAFITKAAAEVLKKYPAVNAEIVGSGDQQEIIYKKYYNVGIAVDTEEGLMLPIIRDVDKKDVFAVAQEIMQLAEKCRSRKIKVEEITGGTFSITNIGSIGGIFATPIVINGQTGNLGVFKIKEKPVVRASKVEIRPMMTLTLSYDHRVVDGAYAARFMNELVAALENIA